MEMIFTVGIVLVCISLMILYTVILGVVFLMCRSAILDSNYVESVVFGSVFILLLGLLMTIVGIVI